MWSLARIFHVSCKISNSNTIFQQTTRNILKHPKSSVLTAACLKNDENNLLQLFSHFLFKKIVYREIFNRNFLLLILSVFQVAFVVINYILIKVWSNCLPIELLLNLFWCLQLIAIGINGLEVVSFQSNRCVFEVSIFFLFQTICTLGSSKKVRL